MPLYNPPGTDPTAIHTDVAGEISGLTVKTTPVAADLLVVEDSAASFGKKKITLDTLPLSDRIGTTSVSATDAPTTTSTSDVLITSMALTPGAGTFIAFFVMTWRGSTASVTGSFSIYVNGVQVSASQMNQRVTAGGASMIVTLSQMVTPTAGQVVDVRWHASTGTLTGGTRFFRLTKTP